MLKIVPIEEGGNFYRVCKNHKDALHLKKYLRTLTPNKVSVRKHGCDV